MFVAWGEQCNKFSVQGLNRLDLRLYTSRKRSGHEFELEITSLSLPSPIQQANSASKQVIIRNLISVTQRVTAQNQNR
jgi:hypothetical protein